MEIVSAKYLLTMNNSDEPMEDGAIATELGKIKAVGNANDLKKKYPEALLIEHPKQVIMPGLVNADTRLDCTNLHANINSFLKEQPTSSDYINWLISIIKYRENISTTELIGNIQNGTKQMIDNGITTVGDSTIFEGEFRILDEIGIRAIIYSEIYGGTSSTSQDLFENALAIAEKHYDPSNNSLLNAGFAPAAAYLLSKNLLKILAQHAEDGEVPIKIHAAESFAEMEFFFDSKGVIGERLFPSVGWENELPPAHQKTPIGYLDQIGFLSSAPSIVGGIHLSENCYKLLARHMCRIAYCPTNNSFFGHGTLPFEKLQQYGIPIGIGTGIRTTNRQCSMWDEMREILKNSTGSPTPKEIVQMATVGSARALGLENQIGGLQAGKLADYIIVDLPPGYEVDKAYIYGALIRNTKNHNIKRTVVNGEVLKSI